MMLKEQLTRCGFSLIIMKSVDISCVIHVQKTVHTAASNETYFGSCTHTQINWTWALDEVVPATKLPVRPRLSQGLPVNPFPHPPLHKTYPSLDSSDKPASMLNQPTVKRSLNSTSSTAAGFSLTACTQCMQFGWKTHCRGNGIWQRKRAARRLNQKVLIFLVTLHWRGTNLTYFRDEQLDLPSASCCSRRSWGRCGARGGEGGESGGGVTLLQEEGGQTWRRESCETFQSNREDAPVLCTRGRVKPSSDQLQRKREMDSQTAVNEAVVYPPPLHFTRQGANVSTQKWRSPHVHTETRTAEGEP